MLAAVCGGSAAASFVVVLQIDRVAGLAERLAAHATMPHIVIGAAGGLAFYLWRVTEGHPFVATMAVFHTLIGGVFGLIASKAAAGYGLNESLQTATAGIGGATGPRGIDIAAEMVRREKKD